jgi:hypothetical protein
MPGSHSCRPDPRPRDLGGQPSARGSRPRRRRSCHCTGGAVGAPGKQERGDIAVQRPAGLDVAVVLDIDCVAEQGPPVAVVVEEVSQPRQSSARSRGDLSGGLRRGQVRRCPMRGSAIGNGNRVSATLDLTGKGRFTVVTGLAGQS